MAVEVENFPFYCFISLHVEQSSFLSGSPTAQLIVIIVKKEYGNKYKSDKRKSDKYKEMKNLSDFRNGGHFLLAAHVPVALQNSDR